MESNKQDDSFESLKQQSFLELPLLVKLLKNPLYAMQLDSRQHTNYGWMGIAASVIGFTIGGWLLVLKLNTAAHLMLAFFMGSGLLLSGTSSGVMLAKILLLGVLSNVSLFIAIWLISLWKGGRRHTLKTIITKLGAMQFIGGAIFLVAGILTLLSAQLAFLLIFIGLIYTLLVTMIGALELYIVEEDNKAIFIISILAAYTLLLLTFSQFIM